MLKQLTGIRGVPLQGGAVTVRNAAQLPYGTFSEMENLRNRHPGLVLRGGQEKLHVDAIGAPDRITSLFQFKKTEFDEDHFYAQIADGNIYEANIMPPVSGLGAFGLSVFAGSVGQVPASWAILVDTLLMANGVDQHQIYAGDKSYVDKLIAYRSGSGDIPFLPTIGEDLSLAVRNTRDDDLADISSLLSLVSGHCLFIRTPVPVTGFYFTIKNANTTATSLTVKYFNGDFMPVFNLVDGTKNGSVSFGRSGEISFDTQVDILPKYMYGANAFWYQLSFSTQLSPDVKINTITYKTDFQSITNVWNGVYDDAVEVRVDGVDNEFTYPSGAVDISEITINTPIRFAATDKIEGIYIDVGATPNETGATISGIRYWTGVDFASVGDFDDGTNGLSNSGLIKFDRKDAQPHQYNTSGYHAFWYDFYLDTVVAEDVVISIQVMPYFDINELGRSYCNCAWKDRAIYSFDQYGAYIYISQVGSPMVLNGTDYGILKAGDGRSNKIVAMQRFHNELMVWQEEKGVAGGCVTLFEGYSPETFGKLLLSTKIGTMNSQSVAVVEGVLTATATDEVIRTLVFFLSRSGVCVTDGRTISLVSDDIQNYFDSKKDEYINCIYEKKMWLMHDSSDNVLRLGLVSGTLASDVNVFPVFDLVSKTWGFDTYEHKPTCMIEIGTYRVMQVAGGLTGFVYLMNEASRDIDTAIDGNVRIEFNYNGEVLQMREYLIRFGAQVRGDVILEFFKNNIACLNKTLSMRAENPAQIVKRERGSVNIIDQNISVKISISGDNIEMNLIEFGTLVNIWDRR